MNLRKIKLRINEAMQRRGMTQIQLSELSGVRQAAISEMSRNIREQVNIRNLEKIADALGIDDIGELIHIEKN